VVGFQVSVLLEVHLGSAVAGAFIALLIALRRPDVVRRLVLVSGGFHRDGLISGAGEFDVDAAVQALAPSFGEVSPDGAERFRVVVEKTAALESTEPALAASELGKVKAGTLVMFGDDDLVTIDHMATRCEGVPDSGLAIVPGHIALPPPGEARPVQRDHSRLPEHGPDPDGRTGPAGANHKGRIEMSKAHRLHLLMPDGVMQSTGDAGEFDREVGRSPFFDDGAGAIVEGAGAIVEGANFHAVHRVGEALGDTSIASASATPTRC
jgi:hypothetical protein